MSLKQGTKVNYTDPNFLDELTKRGVSSRSKFPVDWESFKSEVEQANPAFLFSRDESESESDPDDDEEAHGPKHTSRSAASFFTNANNLPGNAPSSLTRTVTTRVDAATRQTTEPNRPVHSPTLARNLPPTSLTGIVDEMDGLDGVEVSEAHKLSKPEHQGHDFTINDPVRQENGKWVCNHKCKDKEM